MARNRLVFQAPGRPPNKSDVVILRFVSCVTDSAYGAGVTSNPIRGGCCETHMLPVLSRNLQRSENPGREDFLRQRLLSRGVLESPTRNLSSCQIRLFRLQRYLSPFRDRLGDAPIRDDRERYVSGANFVHGDLSAYNILVHDGAVWLIDFPQAVDPRTNAKCVRPVPS
jgi:RIO1 family